MKALLFDCDGTLADTEMHGHLPAFNQTFREFGLPVQWSEAEYGRLLRIGGGKERMASLLRPAFVEAAGLPTDPAALLEHVARWHRRKTEIYVSLVRSGQLPPRPGISRLIADALEAGWTLGVVSTSAEASVRSILELAAGPGGAARFTLVLAGDIVARKKPAPDIYLLALERLGLPAREVLALEDSRNGLLAAHGAGIACLVTVNDYTALEGFSEAQMVVTSLGDPDGEQAIVLANRTAARPAGYLTLGDLEAIVFAA